MFDQISAYLAKREFKSARVGFYLDRANSLSDREDIKDFLSSSIQFADKSGQTNMKLILTLMISNVRDRNEWEMSGILKGLVPAEDMMTLQAVDNATDPEEQIRLLRDLAADITLMDKLKSEVYKTLFDPLISLPMALAYSMIIGALYMPELDLLVSHTKWLNYERWYYAYSYYSVHYWFIWIPALIGLLVLIAWSHANWVGRSREFVESMPIIGLTYTLYRNFQAARFLKLLGSFLGQRTNLIDALSALKINNSNLMIWHIDQIIERLRYRSEDIVGSMDTGLLTDRVYFRLSKVLGRKGGVDEGLNKLADFAVSDLKNSIDATAKKLKLTVMVIVFILIGVNYGMNAVINYHVTKQLKSEAVIN